MAEKEAIAFVIDVGKSMGQIKHGRTKSDLDWSMQWVWDRITNIVSLGRKTLVAGIIGLGTDVTDNDMSDDASYKHISILQAMKPMLMPELRALTPLIKASNSDHRDAMSAIILAVDMIMRHCRQLQYRKKIYLITNATGMMDPDDTDSIAAQIKQHQIELTVLGIDFDDPEYGFQEEDKPAVKTKNEELLKHLVDSAGGVLGTMQEAIESLATPNVKPVRPIPTYKGQLRLGDASHYDTAITIDVERYFKVSVRRPPTASSFVIRPETESTGFAAVQNARSYVVHDSDEPNNEKHVDREELAKGYQYGRTAVPISEADENITKLETFAGYEILGFIPREKIERYMILDNTNVLVPQKGNDKAALALSSMIHALFEIDSCAISRFVKKDMSEPQLTLLTPYADGEVECLIENILPFAEDLRQYRFPPVDTVLTVAGKRLQTHRNLPSDKLVEAMSEFVDNMTLLDQDQDQFRPEDVYSPVFHSIEGAIKYRAVHGDKKLPPVPASFLMPSKQPQELQDRSRSSLRELVAAADVKKVPPKVKGRGRKHREAEKPLSGLDVAQLFRNEKGSKISPRNAIPEFKQIIETTESLETVHDAARQLLTIIEEEIRTSFGDSNYERAVEQLRVLRDELQELEEFDIWHELIQSLKHKVLSDALGGNRKEVWFRIRRERLGLIDTTQEQNSTVTKGEADEFLSSREP